MVSLCFVHRAVKRQGRRTKFVLPPVVNSAHPVFRAGGYATTSRAETGNFGGSTSCSSSLDISSFCVSVFGGFALAGGHLAALLQPIELLMIGGAAAGAFFVGNTVEGDQGDAEGAADRR